MGIEDRGYYRGDGNVGLFAGRDAVKYLIIANVVIYVLQIIWTMPPGVGDQSAAVEMMDLEGMRPSVLEEWFKLDPQKVIRGQVWRLTTYDFLHSRASVMHLLFNMYLLYLVGERLEARYGFSEFLAFYLVAGFVSGLVFLGLGLWLRQLNPAIGASGAVIAAMILYALLWPDEEWMIFIFRIKVKWIALLTLILDLHPVLLQLSGVRTSDGVAHACHLGGIAFGFLYYRFDWRLTTFWDDLRQRFRRSVRVMTGPKLTIHHDEPEDEAPPPASFEDRMDAVLAKVHAEGKESLTPEEQEILVEAGKRIRRRKGQV